MNIAVISGSHRINSQSKKVADFCQKLIKELGGTSQIIDLAGNPFPFWDESFWELGAEKWQGGVFQEAASILNHCDGVMLVSPEWSGMVPPGLKNMFLLAGTSLAHKPAMIVGVSSGMSGTWPVAELKISSSKNTRMVYIPEHVIIRHIEKILNEAIPADEADQWVRDRLRYSIDILMAYAGALQAVRQSGKVDLKTYPSGM